MRNLKRILSAALALVMSMSIATVASAAVDFKDSADINYDEAVAVMSTIGVLEGYNGEFDPAGSLTREQAAKIIAYMLLGDDASKLSVADSRYKDVAANRWSAGVIEYCSEIGILAGNGDGTYNPEGKLTGYEFAKMLLGALGYKAEIEGFVGPAWTLNVTTYAHEIGLDAGIQDLKWGDALTRETAAQMAMNAVKSPMVQYKSGSTIIINGEKVTFGSGDAYYVTSTLAKEQRISTEKLTNSDDYTVEFGERYFPELYLRADTDEFERPARTWTYKNDVIGTYVNYELMVAEYTTGVTGRELYDLLGKNNIADYDFYNYVDGVEGPVGKGDLTRNNDRNLVPTGNGVLTQVFVDHDSEDIILTHVNTYLAKATSDYNAKTEKASFEVYYHVTRTGTPIVATTDKSAKSAELVDVPAVEDVTKGQYVLVNMSGKDRGTSIAAMDIVSIFDVETVTDVKVTKFSQGGSEIDQALFSKLTADGEEYSASKKAAYNADVLNLYADGLLTDMSYNVYVDQYGYAIGVDLFEGEPNYVFITGYDRGASNISVKTAKAAAIFLDGEMKEITVNTTATNKNITAAADSNFAPWGNTANGGDPDLNRWYTYVETDGVYTLKPATRMFGTNFATTTTINSSNVRLDNAAGTKRAYGEDDSIFITVDTDSVDTLANKAITEVTGLYTGVQNVEIEVAPNDGTTDPTSCIYTLYDSNYFIIASIVVGDAVGSNANYAYILDTNADSEYIKDGVYYWEFDAIMDGQVVTLTATGDYADIFGVLRTATNRVVELRFNADNHVVSVKDNLVVYDETDYMNPINGEDLYDVELSVGSDIGELRLQGRTLYVTNDRTDRGLTFTSDAKAVVIQNEDNSTDVIREYASVSEALANLADADPDTTALEYEGQITAVLDNLGRAVWIVFDNENGLSSNSGIKPPVGFKLTGVEKTISNGSWMQTDLVGTGTIPAGSKIQVTLMKQSKTDGDSLIGIKEFTTVATAAAVNTFDGVHAPGLHVPTGGSYYMIVDVLNSRGDVVASATTPAVYCAP